VLAEPTVAEALSPDVIEPCCREAGHRWRRSFWSPTMTVMVFLLQVLSAEKTLRAAVAALLAQLTAKGETDLPSPDASAYTPRSALRRAAHAEDTILSPT